MGKLQVDVIKKCLDEASKGCLQTADEPPRSHFPLGVWHLQLSLPGEELEAQMVICPGCSVGKGQSDLGTPA